MGLGSRGNRHFTMHFFKKTRNIHWKLEMEEHWVLRIRVQGWWGQEGEQLPREQCGASVFFFFEEGEYISNALRKAEHRISGFRANQQK